jgi:hypothetical protein
MLPFGADVASWSEVWLPALPEAAGAAALGGLACASFSAARAAIAKVAPAARARLRASPRILSIIGLPLSGTAERAGRITSAFRREADQSIAFGFSRSKWTARKTRRDD